ncbi:hypothetical protein JNB88_05600 [Rhizobium cauense]|uniref:hypothetical protein n=1 Tax=Rhizobium cauense TaxID=1166683 RepID=UPI001C6EB965|nr:hypothetical protein [Rhizobium cauense]MBW9113122.1 hypothetical protein [Rhizobium cauense]
MDRMQRSRPDEKATYDRHAVRLILHMRESKRLLDSFTLRNDGDGARTGNQPSGKH